MLIGGKRSRTTQTYLTRPERSSSELSKNVRLLIRMQAKLHPQSKRQHPFWFWGVPSASRHITCSASRPVSNVLWIGIQRAWQKEVFEIKSIKWSAFTVQSNGNSDAWYSDLTETGINLVPVHGQEIRSTIRNRAIVLMQLLRHLLRPNLVIPFDTLSSYILRSDC